jgi:hypothetical protein
MFGSCGEERFEAKISPRCGFIRLNFTNNVAISTYITYRGKTLEVNKLKCKELG